MAEHRGYRAPDFIIAGGMKCATTALHDVLARHPDVYIPDDELFLFDIDDWRQHAEFRIYDGDRWWNPEYTEQPGSLWDWYNKFFEEASEGQLIGEDSPTYLASREAPERIARVLPEAKIIVLLRDPTSRLYSHYWHDVRHGRAFHSFEDTLRFSPLPYLDRSLYKPQVKRMIRHFGENKLLFLAFEDYVANPVGVAEQVCVFLGLSDAPQLSAGKLSSNVGAYPRWLWMHLLQNRLQRRVTADRFRSRVNPPWTPSSAPPSHLWRRVIRKLQGCVNPMVKQKKPMREETRKALDTYFAVENQGLDDLVGFPITQRWYRSLS